MRIPFVPMIASFVWFVLIDQIVFYFFKGPLGLNHYLRASLPISGNGFYIFLAIGLQLYGIKGPFFASKIFQHINAAIFGVWFYMALEWLYAPNWTKLMGTGFYWKVVVWGALLCMVVSIMTQLVMIAFQRGFKR